ncbi:DUF4148 domain-containing protein [uncultured Massilia sp.]|uniref:DUF4148 domain-containing protein n=1 Tax=uncultured Massilia sp. TaxID=169973 RepID=UPI0025F474FB|nr:DUF4148 domain-containing protein [uncultured Massilia sp.]
MNKTFLIPVVLAALVAGCASTDTVASSDPVRARVQAELAQARADGTQPLTEAAYVYPNWTASHKAP